MIITVGRIVVGDVGDTVEVREDVDLVGGVVDGLLDEDLGLFVADGELCALVTGGVLGERDKSLVGILEVLGKTVVGILEVLGKALVGILVAFGKALVGILVVRGEVILLLLAAKVLIETGGLSLLRLTTYPSLSVNLSS